MQETIRARVETHLKEQFENAAKSRGLNASQLLRDFMADYVHKHAEQQRRHEETLQAIESIEAGRFIAGEAVFTWLETWGSDTPSDAPQCK